MTASTSIATVLLLLATLNLLKPAQCFSTITMTTSSNAQPLALNLKVKVKPSQRTKFLTAIQANQQSTRMNEPNNLQFVIGQDINDADTFYLHEEFVNCEAFMEHRETEHYRVYKEFVTKEDPFEEPPVMCLYQLREENDDVVTKKRGVHKQSFGLNVNLYPKQSVRNEFLQVISDNKRGTDTLEELALQYSYGESITLDGIAEGSSNTFHFHEQYTGKDHGKEGFDAHASMPHFAAWEEFVKTDPFEKDPEVFFFKIIED